MPAPQSTADMSDVNGRKRKRDGEGKSKPKKKTAIDGDVTEVPGTPIRIKSVKKAKYCPPVIVSAPGVRLDEDITFRTYQKRQTTGRKSSRRHASEQEITLHSTKHRTVDFTAREEEVDTRGEPYQQEYVALYDPKTGGLEVIAAKKMVVRGTVRAKQADEEAMIAPADIKTYQDRKVDLGQTFGTRKAKKIIESNRINAIGPKRGEQDADGNAIAAKLDSAEKATLSHIGQVTSTMASRDELQAAIDESKPVPRANLEADEVADVYDPKVIIGTDVLKAVPVRDWQEAVEKNENIDLASRFVARRIARIGKQEKPLEKLRLMRYLYFLILFYITARDGRQRGTKRVPPRDQLAKNLSPAPQSVIDSIRRKFSDGGEIRKFHMDLIMTHCAALSCIIDNFETKPRDLREDLRLDSKTMNQYFQEIGARIGQRKEPGEAKAQPVAKLAMPLVFPKMSRGAPKRR
ncbi:RNA polymerase I associated factor, A49-like protein [Verticillium dahliae]|nr:RNA polymerase I associated factor, A49-like protein [Verticillium dahliae]